MVSKNDVNDDWRSSLNSCRASKFTDSPFFFFLHCYGHPNIDPDFQVEDRSAATDSQIEKVVQWH